MQICSKCQTQSPDSSSVCPVCQSNLSELSTTAIALKNFQENPRVNYVRITVSDDCCPACREAEGAYDKHEVPKIPVDGCSHSLGCRCFYTPSLDELFP